MNEISLQVELTETGYLVLNAGIAKTHFPHDTLLVFAREKELWLLPTRGAAGGGLLLKQRNPSGDRSVLITEILAESTVPSGALPAFWDESQGALRVALVST